MTSFGSTDSFGSTAAIAEPASLRQARQVADEAQRRWTRNEVVDVAALCRDHESLRRHKTVAIELAYEQYRRLQKAGGPPAAEEFCRRFSTIQKSLLRFIEVQEFFGDGRDFETRPVEPPWPEAGARFLGFDLLVELGQGAFGRVYLAAETELGKRRVALKVAPGGGDEANILGRLSHPNIVPVYSVQRDEASGLTAICMPYLGRATLCDVLDLAFSGGSPPTSAHAVLAAARAVEAPDLALPPSAPHPRHGRTYADSIIALAAQICDGLAHAHRLGILHRDLKPSNILITDDGQPLLLDFNLSTHAEENVVRHGGTLPYMSPETLRAVVATRENEQIPYDARSDLFSLGVVVYELLTGQLPFRVGNWRQPLEGLGRELLDRQRLKPRPVHELNGQVDPAVSQLLNQCFSFDVENRPRDAESLAAAFRQQLSARRRCARWVKRHRGLVSLLTAAVVLLAIFCGTALALRPPYHERKFREAVQLTLDGRSTNAIACLDEVIRVAPDRADAWAARGHLYQQAGEFMHAAEDYARAHELSPHPRWQACRAYCLNKLKYDKVAILYYRLAISGGYSTPAVFNNLGFSCLGGAQLDDAESAFREALAIEPSLGPSQIGLMTVLVNRMRAGTPAPPDTLEWAARFAREPGASAQLLRVVGITYAYAAQRDSGQRHAAVGCLSRAVEKGLDPRSLLGDPALAALQDDERLVELLRRAPAYVRPGAVSSLLDPY